MYLNSFRVDTLEYLIIVGVRLFIFQPISTHYLLNPYPTFIDIHQILLLHSKNFSNYDNVKLNISLNPCPIMPSPPINCSPVAKVEHYEQHWKNTKENQICPRKSVWSVNGAVNSFFSTASTFPIL